MRRAKQTAPCPGHGQPDNPEPPARPCMSSRLGVASPSAPMRWPCCLEPSGPASASVSGVPPLRLTPAFVLAQNRLSASVRLSAVYSQHSYPLWGRSCLVVMHVVVFSLTGIIVELSVLHAFAFWPMRLISPECFGAIQDHLFQVECDTYSSLGHADVLPVGQGACEHRPDCFDSCLWDVCIAA